jgi:hypothetical protein
MWNSLPPRILLIVNNYVNRFPRFLRAGQPGVGIDAGYQSRSSVGFDSGLGVVGLLKEIATEGRNGTTVGMSELEEADGSGGGNEIDSSSPPLPGLPRFPTGHRPVIPDAVRPSSAVAGYFLKARRRCAIAQSPATAEPQRTRVDGSGTRISALT